MKQFQPMKFLHLDLHINFSLRGNWPGTQLYWKMRFLAKFEKFQSISFTEHNHTTDSGNNFSDVLLYPAKKYYENRENLDINLKGENI